MRSTRSPSSPGRGWRLAKEKASRKIDGVVALSFACLDAVAAPPSRRPVYAGEGVPRGHIFDAARGSGAPARAYARATVREAQRERDIQFASEPGIPVNLDRYGGLR